MASEQTYDPFVTVGTEKLPPKIMAKDHQGHSTNVRLKIDPRVHAKLTKMVAMREVEDESVSEFMRTLIAIGLANLETGDFELTNLMRIQAAECKVEELKATEAASAAFVEAMRVNLRETDGAAQEEMLAAALEAHLGMSTKWQAQMDEVLYPYRHLMDAD